MLPKAILRAVIYKGMHINSASYERDFLLKKSAPSTPIICGVYSYRCNVILPSFGRITRFEVSVSMRY